MPYIEPLDRITNDDQSNAGAKAAGLGELMRAGFNTPRGFVVTAAAYRDAFAAVGMNEKISARLAQTEMEDPLELENHAKEIRAWVERMVIPPTLAEEIAEATHALSAPSHLPSAISHPPSAIRHSLFAVRSSLVAQDIPNPNATRVPRAHLGARAENALDALRQVWSILWDTRRIYYRHRKKVDAQELAIAAIIQPLIAADAAGVLFTISPRGNAPDEIHIASTWGLGEAVVSARRAPDRFIVSKRAHTIQSRTIASKTVKEVVANAGGVESVGVAGAEQDAPSLTDAHIIALADLGARIETHFQRAQDVEWCRTGDEIFVLQTRAMQ